MRKRKNHGGSGDPSWLRARLSVSTTHGRADGDVSKGRGSWGHFDAPEQENLPPTMSPDSVGGNGGTLGGVGMKKPRKSLTGGAF